MISAPTKNATRRDKFKAIGRAISILDIEWMSRRGELLPPSPRPVDDPTISSHLFGPVMKTVQLESIEIKMLPSEFPVQEI